MGLSRPRRRRQRSDLLGRADWLTNALYIGPLVVIIGMLAVSSINDRRAEAAEAAAGAPSAEEADDEHAAP